MFHFQNYLSLQEVSLKPKTYNLRTSILAHDSLPESQCDRQPFTTISIIHKIEPVKITKLL